MRQISEAQGSHSTGGIDRGNVNSPRPIASSEYPFHAELLFEKKIQVAFQQYSTHDFF